MNKILSIGIFALAFCGPVDAATVSLQSQDDIRFQLDNVSGTSLIFKLQDNLSGYANFGGYVKWSTRQDGRQDRDGPWSACLECGYSSGSWSLATDGKRETLINLDFGSIKDTVFVWARPTFGQGNLTYADSSIDNVSPVPAPAAGLLLLTAFGGLAALRRRRRRAVSMAA